MNRVLLIDDDEQLGPPLAMYFKRFDLVLEQAFTPSKGLVIDPVRRSVLRHDEEVALTGTEYELLLMLAREPGRVFSRDDILGRLRGHEVDLYSRAVDIVVSRLRRKLEPLVAIKTLRNVGYALALRRQEA